jgi:hypothetical protein
VVLAPQVFDGETSSMRRRPSIRVDPDGTTAPQRETP